MTRSESEVTDDPNITDDPSVSVKTLESTDDPRTDGPALAPNARWLWNQAQPDVKAAYFSFSLLDERYVVHVEAVDEPPEWVNDDE